jgi:hypothetical protein
MDRIGAEAHLRLERFGGYAFKKCFAPLAIGLM